MPSVEARLPPALSVLPVLRWLLDRSASVCVVLRVARVPSIDARFTCFTTPALLPSSVLRLDLVLGEAEPETEMFFKELLPLGALSRFLSLDPLDPRLLFDDLGLVGRDLGLVGLDDFGLACLDEVDPGVVGFDFGDL